MTLPVAFRRVLDHWLLTDVADCVKLTPSDVTLVPSVGPAALDRLRLFLAHRGLALKGDHSASTWLTHWELPGETEPPPYTLCPFTIIQDTNETYPYTFEGLCNREFQRDTREL